MNRQQNRKPSSYSAVALSRLFSAGVFRQLARDGRSSMGQGIIRECRFFPRVGESLRSYLGSAFRRLSESLRSEYVFKNTIAEQILLRNHSLGSAGMFTEFRAGGCKADVVIVNGTSTAYEIKSERDQLGRLQPQLHSYLKVFDRVVVVADECHRRHLSGMLPQDVGLTFLTSQRELAVEREPRTNWGRLDLGLMFDSLRRAEYLGVLALAVSWDATGIPNGVLHGQARQRFAGLEPEIAHLHFVRALRRRADLKANAWFIRRVPASLKGLAVSVPLSRTEQAKILEVLSVPAELALC
jgi:hypothetical protein